MRERIISREERNRLMLKAEKQLRSVWSLYKTATDDFVKQLLYTQYNNQKNFVLELFDDFEAFPEISFNENGIPEIEDFESIYYDYDGDICLMFIDGVAYDGHGNEIAESEVQNVSDLDR